MMIERMRWQVPLDCQGSHMATAFAKAIDDEASNDQEHHTQQ
jgi:hypothetical protein